MMSFYVTLPSDSSLKYFPDNKISNFITQLPTPINLSGEWEVGLSEIIYPHSWFNVNEYRNSFVFGIPDGNITRNVIKAIPPGSYESINDILKAMNDILFHDKVYLGFNKATKKVKITVKDGFSITFNDGLKQLLGFTSETITGTMHSPFVADPHAAFPFFYVYTDIVSPQIVGDVQAPLLRIVKVEGKDGEIISHHFDRPQYLPLIRQSFQTISVELRLNSGNFVPFERGKVIIVLHFRMRQIL